MFFDITTYQAKVLKVQFEAAGPQSREGQEEKWGGTVSHFALILPIYQSADFILYNFQRCFIGLVQSSFFGPLLLSPRHCRPSQLSLEPQPNNSGVSGDPPPASHPQCCYPCLLVQLTKPEQTVLIPRLSNADILFSASHKDTHRRCLLSGRDVQRFQLNYRSPPEQLRGGGVV